MEDSEPDLPSSARGLEVVHPLKSGKMVSKQSASIDETNQHKLQQTQTLTHGVFLRGCWATWGGEEEMSSADSLRCRLATTDESPSK